MTEESEPQTAAKPEELAYVIYGDMNGIFHMNLALARASWGGREPMRFAYMPGTHNPIHGLVTGQTAEVLRTLNAIEAAYKKKSHDGATLLEDFLGDCFKSGQEGVGLGVGSILHRALSDAPFFEGMVKPLITQIYEMGEEWATHCELTAPGQA